MWSYFNCMRDIKTKCKMRVTLSNCVTFNCSIKFFTDPKCYLEVFGTLHTERSEITGILIMLFSVCEIKYFYI